MSYMQRCKKKQNVLYFLKTKKVEFWRKEKVNFEENFGVKNKPLDNIYADLCSNIFSATYELYDLEAI